MALTESWHTKDNPCSFKECYSVTEECVETVCRVEGELADKVRTRMGATGDVTIVEHKYWSGYSDYTVTSCWQEFRVECAEQSVGFGEHEVSGYAGDGKNSIVALLEWLGEPEAAAVYGALQDTQ